MRRYNPRQIEPKWQAVWQKTKLYEVDTAKPPTKKYYVIPMLPYTSGDLHIGHWYNFAPTDTVARWRRMLGHNVLHTNGFDAFGLPAENAAIKTNIPPAEWTRANIERMTEQLKTIGASYDLTKFINTSDPSYYRWTQWLFLQLYEKGLAYKAKAVVNWCPKDQTVLANEQVITVNGVNVCERDGTPVVQKELEQWFFKITNYTERLLADLDAMDWPERVKTMQKNWIGKSQGALIKFAVVIPDSDRESRKMDPRVKPEDDIIEVFTTRPDTIYGATYMVLAPEHPLVEKLKAKSGKHETEIEKYVKRAAGKTELERKADEKTKTGVFSGAYAINPATKKKIPIWIADYVLMSYGSGAIMAVPAHDDRDYGFAKKYNLLIQPVIAPDFGEPLPDEQSVQGVVVVPYDPKTDLYLGLDPWGVGIGLVGGGLEKGETFEDCARRELAEETGIKKIDKLIPLGVPVYSHYYNDLKKINRFSFAQAYLAIVDDSKLAETKLEKHEKFKPKWLKLDPIQTGIAKLSGGDHWLEICDRAEAGVEVYKKGKDYEAGSYDGEGRLFNSDTYNDMTSAEAREKITADLAKAGMAKEETQYRLRDWLISRQRYWGAPIPIIYCEKCGLQPVPEKDLPVVLPENLEFLPTGQSPLLKDPNFMNTKCPKCDGPAKREADTMDVFVDSSWYFLRYPDPKNAKAPFDKQVINAWAPVDHYIGGIEHAILHLLYARFITKFLHDHHGLKFEEPFKKLSNQGIILGPDGQKMSKSRGNVINPDQQVSDYGADSLRLYMMFKGPYDQGGPYSLGGIAGTRRFLDRLWTLVFEFLAAKAGTKGHNAELEVQISRAVHKAIKRVSQDLEVLGFNTAIAAMMEAVNELYKLKSPAGFAVARAAWQTALDGLVQLLAPFAPHIAEELWAELGHGESVHISPWPVWDEALIKEELITLAVQVNGKVRAEITVAADIDEAGAIAAAKAEPKIADLLKGAKVLKAIYVPGRLVSLVVK